MKELKEQVSTLKRNLKEAEETRRERSGVSEEERKRWRDKEESLLQEHDSMARQLRDSMERLKSSEQTNAEMRRREQEMEETITNLTKGIRNNPQDLSPHPSSSPSPRPSPSHSPRPFYGDTKVDDFDFPVTASGPLLSIDSFSFSDEGEEKELQLYTADSQAPNPAAPIAAEMPSGKPNKKKGDLVLKEVAHMQHNITISTEHELAISRLKGELCDARVAIEEARRERREAERRMREESESNQCKWEKERKELEDQIIKLRAFVEESTRKLRASEEKMRKKEKLPLVVSGSKSGKSKPVVLALGASSEAEVERLQGELKEKEREIEELKQRMLESTTATSTSTAIVTTTEAEERKDNKRKGKEKSEKEEEKEEEDAKKKKKKDKKRNAKDKGEQESEEEGEVQESQSEGQPASAKTPTRWHEKAMRLKSKVARIETQLMREKKEKERIKHLLAQREEELSQLQISSSSSSSFPLLSQQAAASTDDMVQSGWHHAMSKSNVAPATAPPQPIVLSPFFRWWRDFNSRPSSRIFTLQALLWPLVASLLLWWLASIFSSSSSS